MTTELSASDKEHLITNFKLHRETASLLLKTEEDSKNFFGKFFRRNRYSIDDMLDFRRFKVNADRKTLATFINECHNGDMKNVFESTFYQTFTVESIELINKAISEERTSLKDLFINFQNNPKTNLMRNIL